MDSSIKVLPNFKKYNAYINDVKNGVNPLMLSGLTDSGKMHFAFSTLFYVEKPIVIVTYNELQARKMVKDLSYFTDDVLFFPKREIFAYDYIAESKEIFYQRMNVLNRLHSRSAKLIVTTIEALMQKIPSEEVLYKNQITVKNGESIDVEQFKEKLISLGYERYELVEAGGQFSSRGGIIDIALNDKCGVRIELWGDEVDSIRYFDLRTQRSTEMINAIQINPVQEFVLERSIEEICKLIKENPKLPDDVIEEDTDAIKNGDFTSKVDKYFCAFYEKPTTFLEYIPKDYILFIDEASKVKARSENIIKDRDAFVKSLIEKRKVIPDSLTILQDYLEFVDKIQKRQIIYLEKQDIGFIDKQTMHAKRNGYSFSYREVNFFRSSMDLLFEELQKAVIAEKTVILLGGSLENCKKLDQTLDEREIPHIFIEDNEPQDVVPGRVIITQGLLSCGFEAFDFNLLVISGEELFTPPKKRKIVSSEFKQGETVVFADLKPGDYIVHKSNGIGQFIGVNTIKADGVVKDYIKIKYRDNDMLYIPTNQLDNIRKYIGAGNAVPKLNRLGSKEWNNTKTRVKNNLKEVAKDLIELYAKRQKISGYAFSKDTAWQRQFEDEFEYTETNDQLRCIEEVKGDMENAKPMDRLLCGDVGYGKTEVAIRAAFKACMDQKQVAYLVPTTILANQQYDSFRERMKDFPIRVELLNRFRTKKEQSAILRKLALGEIDIIIGTHRILSQDVEFKDLGLLIIDEEHRFGVKDKEKIKKLKNNVDVLSMTATPIPRTLHMSIVGIRDMSVIYEPPQNRRTVQTYVLEYDSEVIKEAITKELERKGQVFYLFNNVEQIERKSKEISDLIPEAKVAFAHGQMSGRELEDIMLDFVKGNIDILVCTTILESGIDIPNANTIIVENADRLGLAQLYQIRGRVGRADKQAYAYITYKRDKLLSEIADKRLKAMKEFTEFGSGFKIAMRDLEIRGAGSILGEMQHGHMDEVGYDMYCKLLDEVVKEMKGLPVQEEIEIQIDLNISSFLPDEYIPDSNQKIEIYQNIALCRTEKDIENVTDEMLDRYGNIPKEAQNLLQIARIKNICKKIGVIKVAQKEQVVIFLFEAESFRMEWVDELLKKFRNQIKFSPAKDPYVTFKIKNQENVLKEVQEFLETLKLEEEEIDASNNE
ncbi:MAG: transcription-repair coupling factor [Clostridia bacterium]|nr:transcription-repair coupling factor [Clostridia bacterium]